MCTLNRFPKPFHTYGVKEKAIKLSLAASAPLAKDNCLVGQLSYKQLPNGKSTVQIPVYGTSAAVINQAKATALLIFSPRKLINEQVIASSDVHNPGKDCGVRVIKQRYPYLDRSILSQYTALNTAKYPFARIHKGVFKKRLILSARATPTSASPSASASA